MEPERNIEKELKAYAQQRRAAAGQPPELHPATRKLLQDEAARMAKDASGDMRFARRTYWGLWQRLAAAGAAAVAVFIGCWMFVPGFSKSKKEGSRPVMEMARNGANFKEQRADRSIAENKDKQLGVRRSMMAAKTDTAVNELDSRKLPTEKPAPASPAPAAVPPVVRAPTTAPSFAGALKDSETAGGIGGAATSAPAGKDAAVYLADSPPAAAVQRFQRTGENFSRAGDTGGNPNVLASFSVEQTRNGLRIIDSDGSIYTGAVSRTSKTAKEPVEAANKAVAQDGLSSAEDSKKQPPQLFSFRVSGTNRTLKQEVVFTGNFLPTAAAIAAPTTASGLIATNAPSSSFSGGTNGFHLPLLELQKMRLEGRLVLGKTNQMKIKAAPVKP